jgi:cation diffusion facilitator family transporter
MQQAGDKHEARTAAVFTMLVSASLAVFKAVVGITTGAIVLVTDALDSASDVITALAAYVGIRISDRKPDATFPYGYYKAESITSLFIAAVIFYGAGVFMLKGIDRVVNPAEITHPVLGMSAALISGAVALAMHRYLLHVGHRTKSESIIATSHDRLKDVFASIAVAVGVASSLMGLPFIEGIVTVILALLIIRISFMIAKDSVFSLMDVSPDKAVEQKVRKVLEDSDRVLDFHKLRLRKAGQYIFGDVDIKVRKDMDIHRAHQLAEELKTRIKTSVPGLATLNVHIEPYESETMSVLIPTTDNNGLVSRICQSFESAPYHVLVTMSTKKVFAVRIRRVSAAVKDALREKIDAVALQSVESGSFYKLRDHQVDILVAKGATVRDVIHQMQNGGLDTLKQPED